MPKDPPFPACKELLAQSSLLPFAFTFGFTLLAYCHCRWARDPLISSALAYNLIIVVMRDRSTVLLKRPRLCADAAHQGERIGRERGWRGKE